MPLLETRIDRRESMRHTDEAVELATKGGILCPWRTDSAVQVDELVEDVWYRSLKLRFFSFPVPRNEYPEEASLLPLWGETGKVQC